MYRQPAEPETALALPETIPLQKFLGYYYDVRNGLGWRHKSCLQYAMDMSLEDLKKNIKLTGVEYLDLDKRMKQELYCLAHAYMG